MRKHKSVVAILLAVMMIFTFMPTMSFATNSLGAEEVWDTNYDSVTLTSAGTSTTYTNVKKTYSDGVVKAELNWDGYQTPGPTAYTYYLDFNSSVIGDYNVYNHIAATNFDKKTGEVEGISVKFVEPSYTTSTTKDTNPKAVNFVDAGLSVKVFATGYDPDSYEDQTVTLTASVNPSGSGSAGLVHANFVGTVPSKQVTIKGKDAVESDVAVWDDQDTTKTNILSTGDSTFYDGKTHTLVNNTVPGFEVSYKLQNDTTKAYEAVDAVAMKDAGTYYVDVVVTNTATKKATDHYITFTINTYERETDAADAFDFDRSVKRSSRPGSGSTYVEVAEGVDPLDFIVADYIADSDKEEALKFFAAAYDVVVTADKADASKAVWSIKRNETKFEDLEKEFPTFVKNYNIGSATDTIYSRAQVKYVAAPVVADKEDDVTITFAPNKTFKAKKKTKKLAANKSFTLEAKAESGKAVQWLITKGNKKISIDEETGKITVKKGLKKGTYTVKVKAKTVAGDGYKAAKDTVSIKIKVK